MPYLPILYCLLFHKLSSFRLQYISWQFQFFPINRFEQFLACPFLIYSADVTSVCMYRIRNQIQAYFLRIIFLYKFVNGINQFIRSLNFLFFFLTNDSIILSRQSSISIIRFVSRIRLIASSCSISNPVTSSSPYSIYNL